MPNPANLAINTGMSDQEIADSFKSYLSACYDQQLSLLSDNFPVEEWVTNLTSATDYVLATLFKKYVNTEEYSLVAIGGYGRCELFPRSDIDLLILKSNHSTQNNAIETFIHSLWNLGLDIAQSVRNVDECIIDSHHDLNMLTSCIEARLIAGNETLFNSLNNTVHKLSKKDFLEAKILEQQNRTTKEESDGKLEPNIKTGYGGLRDIQMIMWLNRYCLEQTDAFNLLGLLQENEVTELFDNRRVLWRIRYGLHLINKSAKDRLSFQSQQKLAELFYSDDNKTNAAVERLMKHYYLACLKIRRLNRLVAKLITNALIGESSKHIEINDDFISINQQIALKHPEKLADTPALIWKIFLTLLDHPELQSISPRLARQLREYSSHIVSEEFQKNKASNAFFLEILNHKKPIFRQIQRIHRYQLLTKYIPEFSHITGLMQFDLFHELTVDQHTLRVIYFLDKFKEESPDYPCANEIMENLRYPALLYLAAIFHDIGKGRSGNHSTIGAEITSKFAQESHLVSRPDADLLCFLVRYHLLLSTTAQKKDISDPDVIEKFASHFPNKAHLDYLYLLTLADISATNKTLWNSWRADLMHRLYQNTLQYLNNKHFQCVDIGPNKKKSLSLMKEDPLDVGQLWQHLPDEFFIAESPAVITLKTEALLENSNNDLALLLGDNPPRVFISATTSPDILFARATHFMEKNNLHIVEARLFDDYMKNRAMQQYTFSDDSVLDESLVKRLSKVISGNIPPKPLGKRLNYKPVAFFNLDTLITFKRNDNASLTNLEIVTKDRHGLLSLISRALLQHHVHVRHAKISTFGERAEDNFYITDRDGNPIEDKLTLSKIENTIKSLLDSKES